MHTPSNALLASRCHFGASTRRLGRVDAVKGLGNDGVSYAMVRERRQLTAMRRG